MLLCSLFSISNQVFVATISQSKVVFLHGFLCKAGSFLFRASDNSRKKNQISRDFGGQNRRKMGRFRGNFAGIFRANLAGKQSVNKQRILWLFSGQISQQIDRFCADQTSVFNVFLTEDITCSFNNNTL